MGSLLLRLSIRTRLELVMLAILGGMLFFSLQLVVDKYASTHNLASVRNLTVLAVETGAMAHELHKERGLSAGFIAPRGEKFGNEFTGVADRLRQQLAALGVSTAKIDPLTVVEDQLADGLGRLVDRLDSEARHALWRTLTAIGILLTVVLVVSLARGDLTVQTELHGQDETGQMLIAMREMVDRLSGIIGRVRGTADHLRSSSEQLTTTVQVLSKSASKQVASIEETSSAIEQISASSSQNSDNAKMTDGIASGAAGEQGKGFAVEAGEVRELAERSRLAAQEISAVASHERASGVAQVTSP